MSWKWFLEWNGIREPKQTHCVPKFQYIGIKLEADSRTSFENLHFTARSFFMTEYNKYYAVTSILPNPYLQEVFHWNPVWLVASIIQLLLNANLVRESFHSKEKMIQSQVDLSIEGSLYLLVYILIHSNTSFSYIPSGSIPHRALIEQSNTPFLQLWLKTSDWLSVKKSFITWLFQSYYYKL